MGAALRHQDGKFGRLLLLWLGTLSNGGLLLFFLWHLTGQNELEIYVFAGVVLFALVFTWMSRKVLGDVTIEPEAHADGPTSQRS